MLLEIAIIVYIVTYSLTEAKIFERIRKWEVLQCYFCTSLWISLVLVAHFDYVRLNSGNYYLNILFNAYIVMFFANLIYWLFEIPKRLAKYLESADYAIYEKIKEKPE